MDNINQQAQLWQALSDEQLTDNADAPLPATVLKAPWYIRVMIGCAGWIAASFMFSFIMLLFSEILTDGRFELAVLSIVVLAGCAGVLHHSKRHEFVEQFTLALSISAQGALLYTLLDLAIAQQALLFCLLQVTLVIVMKSDIQRFWSSAMAALAMAIFVQSQGLSYLSASLIFVGWGYVQLHRSKWLSLNCYHFFQPVGYGLLVALMITQFSHAFGLPFWLLFDSANHLNEWAQPVAELLSGLAALVMMWFMSAGGWTKRQMGWIYGVALLLIGLSLNIIGLVVALMIVAVGFGQSKPLITGLGVVSLLAFISSYYYRLDSTLLDKSIYLALFGGAVLLTRLALLRGLKHES